MKINLVMPMGGAGTRFKNVGYECPKPLLELQGKYFFNLACDSVYRHMEVEKLIFVVLEEHVEKFGIDRKILEIYPMAQIEVLDHVLNGAVLTAMRGAEKIQNDLPVIFCDCDLKFSCSAMYDYYAGSSTDADGTLITFASDKDRYSYVRLDSDGFAVETAEKRVISHDAITGAYGFSSSRVFLDAAGAYLENCSYSEYFMSGVYNVLINEGRKVRAFRCDETQSFGTPEEYKVQRAPQGDG